MCLVLYLRHERISRMSFSQCHDHSHDPTDEITGSFRSSPVLVSFFPFILQIILSRKYSYIGTQRTLHSQIKSVPSILEVTHCTCSVILKQVMSQQSSRGGWRDVKPKQGEATYCPQLTWVLWWKAGSNNGGFDVVFHPLR